MINPMRYYIIIIVTLSLNQIQMAQTTYTQQEFNEYKKSIYPIIKVALSDVDEGNRPIIEFTKEDEPIHKLIAGDLYLYCGIDRGDNYELIKRNDIPSSIADSELFQIATDNLNRELEGKIELTNTKQGFKMLVCGNDFEAATILFDWLWDELIEQFSENVVVAVVTKDLVFFTKESDKETILLLQKEIDGIHREGEKLLSKKLYLVTRDNIVEYKFIAP